MKGWKQECLIVLLAVSCLGLSDAVKADQIDENAIKLEEVVVTATKTEKKLEDVPGSVTIITEKDMEKKHIQTVDDALENVVGLFVKRSKGLMDTVTSVRMRGFNGDKYTLVLIDGQPLNDAYTGSVQWGALPVEDIERIEIVRGPVSALYGGNAMGGVINIITRTPEKLELKASGGYGSHDTWRYRFSAGDRLWDRLSLRIAYEKESTDGYVTTPVVKKITSGTGNVSGGYPMDDKYGEPTRWVVGDKGDNSATREVIQGKLSFDFSDTGQISFTAFAGEHEYDYDPPNTYMGTYGDANTYAIAGPDQRARFQPNDFISGTGIGDKETNTYTLAIKETLGPVQLNAQLGTVQETNRYTLESGSGMDNYYNSPGSLSITDAESWFGELRGSIPIMGSHTLTAGASFKYDQADTNEYDIPYYRSYSGKGESKYHSGGNSQNWAIFAQDEWQILDPLTLYVGLRYDVWQVYDGSSGVPGSETDYDSNTESELSPKVAAVWKLTPDTILRASVGHAFRAPTIYELYRTWHWYSTTYQCNPKLKPETVWSYEVGIEQYFFKKKTRFAFNVYRNDIDDLIYSKTEDSIKVRTNAGKGRTYGLEIEASQKLTDWLSLWGNFTYTDARITDNSADPSSENKQVPGVPKIAWNIGLDTQYKWIKGSLIGRYYSKIYTTSDNTDVENGVYGTYEPAFFLDAKLSLAPWKRVELSIYVDNILDKEYYEYYKTDGRTIFAELEIKY